MANSPDLVTFNKLFSSYKNRFIRFAQTYVRDDVIAEDYVIDALVYYWENRHKLPPDTNIPAYILTTIKHKCLNYLQRKRLQEEVEKEMKSHAEWELNTRIATLEACEPTEVFSKETQQILKRAIQNLPDRTREIFIMSRIQLMSHKEIALKTGITTKGVEFHITKALRKLRVELKDYLPALILLFILYF